MNPDIKPTTPNPSEDTTPESPTSAGDEAALQAIEALETESNEIPGAETGSSSDTITPTPSIDGTPTPPNPVITEPLIPSTPAESVTPVPAETTNALTDSLKDETPATPESSTAFQPFTQPKKSKKGLITLVIIVVVVVLGAGAYFGWQYFQTTDNITPEVAPQTTQETTLPSDSETGVTTTLTDIETELSGLDDAEYDDTTLSDSTLYE